MRILVIGHSNLYSTYGAATSIRKHFEALEHCSDLIFIHFYRNNFIDLLKGTKKAPIKGNLDKIEKMWLPISEECFEHTKINMFKHILFITLPNIFFRFNQKWILDKIEKTRPDIIHLNSITLLPLIYYLEKRGILKKSKIIMHVRELVDLTAVNKFSSSLNSISCFICIDYAVKNRLLQLSQIKSGDKECVIQENPFSPSMVLRKELTSLFLPERLTFCVAGVIGPDKGIDFICEAFIKANLNNARLLIIGKSNQYAHKLKIKYNKLSNSILWIGEIPDLSESGVFAKIDCLIRGEKFFCTGRTVFEALYSNNLVLLPGSESEFAKDKQLINFSNYVILYEARKVDSLVSSLKISESLIKRNRIMRTNKVGKDNLDSYSSFFKFKYEELNLNSGDKID